MSEAAFYKHFDKLLASAGTALVPNGRFVIETTANGFNTFKSFYNESELGRTPFTPHFFKASDFYTQEFLESEKHRLGRLFQQEYPENPLESFILSGQGYFDVDSLQEHLKNSREPVNV